MNARSLKPIVDLATHDQPHVTARQVCAYLQVDQRTLRKFIEGGYLKAMRLPGYKREWRIDLSALRVFVEQQHVGPAASTHSTT
jgi:excisionase family DNA binding protein